jgi:hypothetical protein
VRRAGFGSAPPSASTGRRGPRRPRGRRGRRRPRRRSSRRFSLHSTSPDDAPSRVEVLHPPVELDSDRHLLVPGVHPPDESDAVVDLDLQLRPRQPGGQQRQPGLQRGLGPSVGQCECTSRSGDADTMRAGQHGAVGLGTLDLPWMHGGVDGDHAGGQRPLTRTVHQGPAIDVVLKPDHGRTSSSGAPPARRVSRGLAATGRLR